MISYVAVCLLAHEEKGLISNTFCYAKREYSFSARPIGCTPAFLLIFAFGIVWDGMDSSRPTRSGGISDGGHREVHFFGSSDNCIFYEDLLYSEVNLAATFL